MNPITPPHPPVADPRTQGALLAEHLSPDRLRIGEILKQDRRTIVAAATTPDGRVVVLKRYLNSRWRQRLVWLLGRHPVQRELVAATELGSDGFPTLTPLAIGLNRQGGWLITDHIGPDLRQRADRLPRPAEGLFRQAFALAAGLADARWFVRDFKAGNLLVDGRGALLLIDAADARRVARTGVDRARTRMTTLLAKTLREAGHDPALIQRLLQAFTPGPATALTDERPR